MLFALCAIGVSQRSQQRTQGSLFTIQALTPIAKFGIRVKDLVSKSRKRQLSQARGVVCYLAVDELPAP